MTSASTRANSLKATDTPSQDSLDLPAGDPDDLYKAIFEASPDAVVVIDNTGTIVVSNPAVRALFGYDDDRLIGKPIEVLLPTNHRTRHEEHLGNFWNDPRARSISLGFELEGRHNDGSEFPVEVALAPVVLNEHRYVAALVRDARERQQGKGASSLLASIVDSSVDAIIGKTLDGLITSWNTGAEKMYGYQASEMIGQHISKLFPTDSLDELDEALTRIANGGLVEQHDTQRICKDSTVLDVSVTIAPIHDAAGQIIGASAIGRNITNRLALERERRTLDTRLNQSERLESMGRLAGGIAHDFNNLLAVIMNYSTFVSEELDDQPAARADLEQIRAAAERASQLTRQLLAFARREVLKPQILNLDQIIVDVEQLLGRTLGEQVDLMTIPSGDLLSIEADPGQIEQVVVNLVVNARDAMPNGGTITIDTQNVQIEAGDCDLHPNLLPGSYVRLRVSDTGKGIEKDVLEHVFEPFFTTKPHGEGTGLGLPMVFGIVQQAGGDIQLYSEIGIGTTCRVLLPATTQMSIHGQNSDLPSQHRGTETILVVEDEDALREMTRRILTRNGYTVMTCSSGPEAIALVKAGNVRIDLLLTDVIMPKMVGNEVASRIQRLRPDMPVLYMSGYAQPVLGSTLGNETVLLEKPFTEKVILRKVRDVLEGRR